MACMLEAAVAATEAGGIGRPLDRGWEMRSGSKGAGIVVPQVESLARPVADRVVRPGRELILAAVDRPGVSAAFGRGLEAKMLELATTLIQGAGVAWPGPRIVTYSLPSLANPPSPLKNSSFSGAAAATRGSDATWCTCQQGAGRSCRCLRFGDPVELIEESAALRHQHDPRDRSEQSRRFGGNQVRRAARRRRPGESSPRSRGRIWRVRMSVSSAI